MGILEKLKINKKEEAKEVKAGAEVVVKKEEVKKSKTTIKAKADSKTATPVKKSKGSKLFHRILLHPVVTEKSAKEEGNNKYSFIVSVTANKNEIIQSVKEAYGIKPLGVRTLNVEGKKKRYGKYNGRRSGYKKAIVTMPAGKKIDIHEGV
jgi:large subunit ribosomal protein L23